VVGYNRVILIGSLTRDPEIRYNPRGERVVKMNVAIPNERTAVDYLDVTAFWRDQGDPMEKLKKGQWVLIEGKVKQRRWQTPEGQSRTRVEIIGDTIEHLGKYAGR
jgi:single-strand DNA-binding protein